MPFVAKYDIRGVYPKDINERFAFNLGRAFVAFLNVRKVVVGQDARLSSDTLANELIHGIVMQGADVVDIGLCSTPMLYHAARKADAIMVTASHNPKEYNGFKLCRKGAIAIGEEDGLGEIVRLARRGNFPRATRQGCVSKADVIRDYAVVARRFARVRRRLRVVVDAGNGMAGLTVPAVLAGLPVQVVPLFFALDGRFPHHPANTDRPENFRDLQLAVRKHRADAGFLLDGDCDRVAMVDERGRLVSNSGLACLLASAVVRRGDAVVGTVTVSREAVRGLTSMGAKVAVSKVGRTHVSDAMARHNASFGFERSGHFFFKGFNSRDSGEIAMLVALGAMSRARVPVSSLVRRFEPRYSGQGALKPSCSAREMLRRLNRFGHDAAGCDLDGLRLDWKDGWVLVRPSNTEPVVRYYAEADSKKALERMLAMVRKAAGA